MDWSSQLNFKEFCEFCEKTASINKDPKENKHARKLKVLRLFLDACRNRIIDSDRGGGQNQSMYPVMRLLLPYLDKARGSYR